MQSKLEDILKNKERELKLHQRFVDLKNFLEDNVYSLFDLPLREHVESLKRLIERIIPDPRDRTEEMFSGEIFTLLGAIYLHDIGLVKNYNWEQQREILNNLDITDKNLFLNYGIGERLDIPEMAIEIINYLSFSNVVRNLPIEWAITEDSKKAIIRNTQVISHVFNFSHLLHDIFFSDFRHKAFRRFHDRTYTLRPSDAHIKIDSREGIIEVSYQARFPYEIHVLEQARSLLEASFGKFRENVNGRMGFNYTHLIWNVQSDFSHEKGFSDIPEFSPNDGNKEQTFGGRWEDAASILDRALNLGCAALVGEDAAGKTSILRYFVLPQLSAMSGNVFFCEIRENPIRDIKDALFKKSGLSNDPRFDIISICNRLLERDPCFFVIDNCERYARIEPGEREKFERFITFCLEQEDIYLIVAGDKESFFEWYGPFQGMSLSSIHEIKHSEG